MEVLAREPRARIGPRGRHKVPHPVAVGADAADPIAPDQRSQQMVRTADRYAKARGEGALRQIAARLQLLEHPSDMVVVLEHPGHTPCPSVTGAPERARSR